MARITVEDCVDKFPSRFELVLIASQRARMLFSGEEATVDRDNDKNTVIALREIAELTIPIEKMKENLIEEYQTVTIIDEEDENIDTNSSKQDNLDAEKIEDAFSDASKQIEEEIRELSSAEESDLEDNFNVSEDLQSSENISSSANDEKESLS